MSVAAPVQSSPSQGQVTVAAEGVAAAQFARCGFDVSVQSGRDKPAYDLVVAKSGHLLKVFVSGGQDGSWDLTEAYRKRAVDLSSNKANCQWAIDQWLHHHGPQTVCCLVQFQGVPIDDLPRIYLASPYEIALRLRETVERLGCSTLYEKYEWSRAGAESATASTLPSDWTFSEQRIQELQVKGKSGAPQPTLVSKAGSPALVWAASAESVLDRQEELVRTA